MFRIDIKDKYLVYLGKRENIERNKSLDSKVTLTTDSKMTVEVLNAAEPENRPPRTKRLVPIPPRMILGAIMIRTRTRTMTFLCSTSEFLILKKKEVII